MQKNWYAVYTKHGCELKTTALLSKKKIEHYCPFQKETLQWNSRKKNNLKPLFPTVIFVKISGHQLPYVKQLSDIINCFYWLGKPAIIKAAEIEAMQYFAAAFSNIISEKIPVNPSAMLRMINEPVLKNDLNNSFTESVNVKLMLPSLGYMLVAESQSEMELPATHTYHNTRMVS